MKEWQETRLTVEMVVAILFLSLVATHFIVKWFF